MKWADTEAKAASSAPKAVKGTFALDPADLVAEETADHKRPFEIQVSSKGQTLYMCAESAEDQAALLARIDAARRLKVASVEHGGGDGAPLRYRTAEDVAAAGGGAVMPGEPGKKVFTWGVGVLLGVGKADVSGMAVPQRVTAFTTA